MITKEKVRTWCVPVQDNKAYYRPFICSGGLSKADIFLVGINPATQIYPEEMDVDSYVDMLLDYSRFMEFYKSSRLKRGKDEISRTRTGMISFIDYLKKQTSSSIIESDVIPYPTENVKLLKKEPIEIIERGKEIFYELVMEFKPRIIIFHGKKSIEHAYDIFVKKGLIDTNSLNVELSIEDMESQGVVCTFNYPSGGICSIMACRHFMYYGNSGQSFERFRERAFEIYIRGLGKSNVTENFYDRDF